MASKPETANKEALDKINAQLECSICLESFTNPKLLPCFHVFCAECLEQIIEKKYGDKSLFNCPKCRRNTDVPDRGIASLQSDFHVDHLFEIRDTLSKANETAKTQCEKCKKTGSFATGFCQECGKFVCEKCTELHQMWDELSTHKIMTLGEVETEAIKLVPPKKTVVHCSKHPELELRIYCEDCQELICNDCTIKRHHGHNFDLIADTFPKHKKEIEVNLEPVREKLTLVDKSLEDFATAGQEIEKQGECIEVDVNKEIDELIELLGQQRHKLIGQTRQIVQQKLKDLAAQKDLVECVQVQLSSCVAHVEGSLTTGTMAEVLAMKARVLGQIQQVLKVVESTTVSPQEMANLQFVVEDRVNTRQVCCSVATVSVCDVSLEKSFVSYGLNAKKCSVGTISFISLQVMASDGTPYEGDVPSLSAELVPCQSKSAAVLIKCDIKRQENKSKYHVIFTATKTGDHQLHVRIFGKDINGSPLKLVVGVPGKQQSKASVKKVVALSARYSDPPAQSPMKSGTPTRVIRNLLEPRGIAKNSIGEILVAEQRSNQIIIYSPDWRQIKSFGSKGTAPGQFTVPVGVAVDNDDNIYVVDNNNHRVQKFKPDGKLLACVGTRGSKSLEFEHPIGIGFNKKTNRLYVCDQNNHRVQVLRTDLTFHSTFGTEGTDDGSFDQCHDIAFDSIGNVYVTDWNNKRFQVFTPEGVFLRQAKFKEHGVPLSSPYGIAVGAGDTVYVGDKTCIAVFTSEGKFVRSFGSQGKKEGDFDGAGPLYADEHCLLVSDRYNNRIQVFLL